MKELDVVRVVKILEFERDFDGSESVKRLPQIGDTGTVVHAHSDGNQFIVECVDCDGFTVWLADFSIEELQIDEKQ